MTGKDGDKLDGVLVYLPGKNDRMETPPETGDSNFKSDTYEILYGGARGGGKTDCAMAKILYHKDHPLFRALVIRKNYTDLKDWRDRALRMYSGCGVKK